MAQRTGHGTGKGVPRHEVKPWDEQRHPEAGGAVPQIARNEKGQPASSADASALAKMPRATTWVPRAIACNPRFVVHNRRRVEYTRGRRGELYRAWGHVSRAVGAQIVAAGWLWAAGECASEIAAETLDLDAFRTASSLYAQAKVLEAAAWELAERESKVFAADKRKADPLDAHMEAAMADLAKRLVPENG